MVQRPIVNIDLMHEFLAEIYFATELWYTGELWYSYALSARLDKRRWNWIWLKKKKKKET